MPPIHPEPGLGLVHTVRTDHLRHTRIQGCELLILPCFHVFKIVRAAKIILCAGTAYGGMVGIPIQIKLDFPFTPPAAGIDAPAYIGPYILPLPLDPVQDHMGYFELGGVGPAELSVKVGQAFR